jgi:hypothetical protein
MRMKNDFIIKFSSTEKQAARDGILFPLTSVDPAYAAGPIDYVTTNLLNAWAISRRMPLGGG